MRIAPDSVQNVPLARGDAGTSEYAGAFALPGGPMPGLAPSGTRPGIGS